MAGLFVKLDVAWVDHPKLIRAGMDGAGLHATACCIAKRGDSDGWIDRMLLHRYGATDDLIDRLLGLELLEAEAEQVRPWKWLDRNPSQAAIAAKAASKSEAGKRGNHKRWGHPGAFESCPECQVVAGSDRYGSQSDPKSSPETEPPLRSQCDPGAVVAYIAGQVRDEPEATAASRSAARSALRSVPGDASNPAGGSGPVHDDAGVAL